MGVLGGPFAVAASLLLIAGAAKAARPETTAGALAGVGMPVPAALVRVGGAAEAAIGAGALVVGTAPFAAALGLSYLGFAGFVLLALARRVPISSCGCFGREDTPPTMVHVAIDLACAGVAAAVALGDGGTIADILGGQPLAGVPFLLLVATSAWFAYLALGPLARVTTLGTRS